jgi:diguanylate cyclase (GGDEF)-like protein
MAVDKPRHVARARRLLDRGLSPSAGFAVAVGLTFAIAVGDYLTGPYLVFATFYLAPVAVAAWFAGTRAGLAVAFLAAVLGLVSTALDPQAVTPPVYVWNAIFRFITYAVVAELIVLERAAVTQLEATATVDSLTGMFNRRHFYDVAERELARAVRNESPVAVIYLDVDDLKVRNDTYGHQAGDAMLSEFAGICRSEFRSTDLLARLGGDEFCFLLPDTELAEAERVLERLTRALHDAELLPIRFSAGLVAGRARTTDVEALIHRADALMYDAKRSGKGRWSSIAI